MSTGLYTWGRASNGQLGHGRKQRPDVLQPTSVHTLASRPLTQLACGHFHTAAVVETEVHTWGRGALGLLGHGDEEDSVQPRPVRALSGIAIRSVACGVYQTAAVSDRGELYQWGWRFERAGPSGNSVVEGYSTLPERVFGALAEVEVRQAACGHYCTAACTSDGALFTWGKGDRGQLGHGHHRDVYEPERVRGEIERQFCWEAKFGKHWLLVLTASGEVCSCGAADYGVLGHGRSPSAAAAAMLLMSGGAGATNALIPAGGADEPSLRPIAALQGARVCAIAAGEAHCACILSEGGEVCTWGSAAYGKLGLDAVEDVLTPTAVPLLMGKRFVEVACGIHSTLALTDGGQVYSWGAHAVQASPPQRVRMATASCTLAAGGGHYAAAAGEYPVVSAADQKLARAIGFEAPKTRAILPQVAGEVGPMTALIECPVPADAEPDVVLRELHELRGLLAMEERKRDTINAELMQLQQDLQQVLVDEEMLRERRGGVEPPQEPVLSKGLALVDSKTYASMLPDEQFEANLFGFKVAIATTKSQPVALA